MRIKMSALFALLISAHLLWAPAAGQEAATEEPADPAPTPAGFAVRFDGQTLLELYATVGSFSAEDRARAAADRLERLFATPGFSAGSITITEHDDATALVSGEETIVVINDEDAAPKDLPRQVVAWRAAEEARRALGVVRKKPTGEVFWQGALYAAIATVVFIVVILLLRRIFKLLDKAVERWRETRLHSIKLQNAEILPADRVAAALSAIIKLLRLVVLLPLLYYFLSLVLGFFPQTARVADVLLSYILGALEAIGRGFSAHLPDLIFIVVIIVLARWFLRFVDLIFDAIGKGSIAIPGFDPEWTTPTHKLVRVGVILIAAAAVFPYIPGSSSPAFQTISIFLGLLLSLGSTSAIANIIGGVVITYMRPFNVGDRVQVADTIGDVVEKSLFVIRVKTLKNVEVTIPNAMVLTNHLINFSASAQHQGLILHARVTISYDVPWRRIHELLVGAAGKTENVLADPTPFVLQLGLDNFAVSYELNAHTDKPHEMVGTYSALYQNIQDACNEAGIEIMSPTYTSVRDGNRAAIPDEYLPKSYSAPSFRISPLDIFTRRHGEPPPPDGQ